MGTFSKDLFLPSLLDRLTNEDPVNQLISAVKEDIQQVEKELNSLITQQESIERKEKQHQLHQRLAGLNLRYNTLNDSIIAKYDIQSCVKRDLKWLFNTNQYFPPEALKELPESTCSVLNFGIPDLIGKTVSGLDMVELERALMQAIVDFEPRIIQKTLTVKVLANQDNREHNIFIFEIEGEIWAQPLPFYLRLRTEFELENNQVTFYDLNEK
jgi:type VI secretion system lysozyme-like protein